jgi:hypothetical protein
MACGSCNTFGAKFFTDGYIDGPMYVHESQLFKCPECSKLAWYDEFESEESSEPGFSGSNGPVDFEKYPDLLEEKPWRNIKDEKYMRIRAWWVANAKNRVSTVKDSDFSDQEVENLQVLLTILNKSEQEQLMKAEIHRELGQFEQCKKALQNVRDENLEMYSASIGQFAEAGTASVMQVNFGEE